LKRVLWIKKKMSEPHHSCCSGAHGTSSSMVQSLTEMDFERGLWGAALVCDNFDNYLFCDFKLERFSAENSVK
jgi:hypothetical protein